MPAKKSKKEEPDIEVLEERTISQRKLPDDLLPYPSHSESFETYYYLGEKRTLRETAILRVKHYIPNCPPNDPSFASKFESFYTKIKRWAAKEYWKEWVRRKDLEERQKNEEQMREKIVQSQKNIVAYRGMLQQGLVVFSRRVHRAMRLMSEVQKLEEALAAEREDDRRRELETEIRTVRRLVEQQGIEIKSFKEAKECVELDIYLGSVLDKMPEVSALERNKLSDVESEKVDKIMEFIHKAARDWERPGGDESDEELIEGEEETDEDASEGKLT